MGIQIVYDEHIRVMVWAALRPHPDGPLAWAFEDDESFRTHRLLPEDAARVGAMLHDQNRSNYNERYGEGDDDDAPASRPYEHAAPQQTAWSPTELFTAIDFYVHQSFTGEEFDEPLSTEALQFCGALVRRIGPDLPGWGTESFTAEVYSTARTSPRPWKRRAPHAPVLIVPDSAIGIRSGLAAQQMIHTDRMAETSTYESQLAMWPSQESQRIALNDDLALSRPVEHLAYFHHRTSAEAAATELRKRGFVVSTERRGLNTSLQATREEILGIVSVTRFLSEVVTVIERESGSYDGWGAAVAIKP